METLSQQQRWLLLLSNTPGLGERGLAVLLGSGLPLRSLFELPVEELCGRFGLTRRAAEAISGAGGGAQQPRIAPLERLVRRYGIQLLVHGHPAYPERLRRTEAAPPLLYAYGNLCLLGYPSVALLSSSGESRDALEQTARLSDALVRAGAVVVAGHNRPGYRAAASAAKAAGGGIVYALDRGLLDAFSGDLDRDLFPTVRLWGYHFDRERTLALSPYALEARFAGLHNRARDRLVASLADVVVAVWVRQGGVMERECRAAHARGTSVYVCQMPDLPAGNESLLTDGFPALPDNPAEILQQQGAQHLDTQQGCGL